MVSKWGLASISIVAVAFMPEVLDDLVRIERKSNGAAVGCNIGEDIIERAGDVLAPESRRGVPVTNRLGAKAEIPRIVGDLSGKLEIHQVLGTAKVINDCSVHG